jgi:hypothetical protein
VKLSQNPGRGTCTITSLLRAASSQEEANSDWPPLVWIPAPRDVAQFARRPGRERGPKRPRERPATQWTWTTTTRVEAAGGIASTVQNVEKRVQGPSNIKGSGLGRVAVSRRRCYAAQLESQSAPSVRFWVSATNRCRISLIPVSSATYASS